MATDTAFYIGRLTITRIGWSPNTAPATVALRLRQPRHHPLCGWQLSASTPSAMRMATTGDNDPLRHPRHHPHWMAVTDGYDRMASFPLQYLSHC